jgi:hypothetical protein
MSLWEAETLIMRRKSRLGSREMGFDGELLRTLLLGGARQDQTLFSNTHPSSRLSCIQVALEERKSIVCSIGGSQIRLNTSE